MRVAVGTSSFSSSTLFAHISEENTLIPVTLPPGRLKPATKPSWTGSGTAVNTIGIVEVAALAAGAEGDPPGRKNCGYPLIDELSG